MDILQAFNDIDNVPISDPIGSIAGQSQLNNISTMQIGTGNQAFHGDRQGIWLGAERFTDAPFSIAMDGSLKITGPSSSSLLTDQVLVFYNSGVPVIVIGDPSTI